MKLVEYVLAHALRGACTCGKCIDAPPAPELNQPGGHTVDLTFFKVAANGGSKEELLALVEQEFPHWLDGKEHSYIELGAELGDQGLALETIGLGHLLGLWTALSPDTMMPFLPAETKQMMAGNGLVALQSKGGTP